MEKKLTSAQKKIVNYLLENKGNINAMIHHKPYSGRDSWTVRGLWVNITEATARAVIDHLKLVNISDYNALSGYIGTSVYVLNENLYRYNKQSDKPQTEEVEQVKDGCQTCKKYDNPFCSNSYHVVNQPVQQEEPEQFYCRNISGGTQPKCDSQCHTCKKAVQYRQNETQLLLASKFIKDIHPSTPIVSEGEQCNNPDCINKDCDECFRLANDNWYKKEREVRETAADKLRNALTPIYSLANNLLLGVDKKILSEQAIQIENNRSLIDQLLTELDLLSPNREEGRELKEILPSGKDWDKYVICKSIIEDKSKSVAYEHGFKDCLIEIKKRIRKLSPSSTPLEQKELKYIADEDAFAIHEIYRNNGHQWDADNIKNVIHKVINTNPILLEVVRYLESKGYKL